MVYIDPKMCGLSSFCKNMIFDLFIIMLFLVTGKIGNK